VIPNPPDNEGTLAYDLIAGLDGMLTGATSSTARPLYTTQDHNNGAYIRNESNWAFSKVQAMTSISPWNSDSAFQKAGILVSPRHVLFAKHFRPAQGSSIRFIQADNTVITRTLSGIIDLPTSGELYPDITIAVLNSDVPSGISFAKVLPSGFQNKLPSSIQPVRIPCAATDQEEKLLTVDLATLPYQNTGTEYCAMQVPTSSLRLAFNEGLVSGDSGNPAFWFIGSDLVLLTMWTGAQNGGYGTSVAAFRDDINAAMTTLGGGYQLTTVDLSSYPNI
jgi:hypothetical protein